MRGSPSPIEIEATIGQWVEDTHIASAGSYFVLLGMAQHFLGDYQNAQRALERTEEYLTGLTDNVLKRLWFVFRIVNTLRLSVSEPVDTVLNELGPLIEKVEVWAGLGPLLRPYLAWIRAEVSRFQGRPRDARNHFLDAADIAHEHGYTLLEGHLNECIVELMLANHSRSARPYFIEALGHYRQCRAERKEANLMSRFPGYAEDISAPLGMVLGPVQTVSAHPSLDINYLMKSALAISSETDIETLLHKIMIILLEASGAQHGYFLDRTDDEIVVLAECHAGKKNKTEVAGRSVGTVSGLCHAIVNYVLRTGEKVILNDASSDEQFGESEEVKTYNLRSIMCLPVAKQAVVNGVLYLENCLSDGVFTSEKCVMTDLLISQATISLENARLIQKVQRLNKGLEQRVH